HCGPFWQGSAGKRVQRVTAANAPRGEGLPGDKPVAPSAEWPDGRAVRALAAKAPTAAGVWPLEHVVRLRQRRGLAHCWAPNFGRSSPQSMLLDSVRALAGRLRGGP